MNSLPVEATALYREIAIKKSKPWAKLYLVLSALYDKNIYSITAKEIEEKTLGTDFEIRRSFAWEILGLFTKLNLVSKIKRGRKDSFVLSENLFIHKQDMIRFSQIALKVTKQEEGS